MLSEEGAAEILVRLFDESEGCVRDDLEVPESFFLFLLNESARLLDCACSRSFFERMGKS